MSRVVSISLLTVSTSTQTLALQLNQNQNLLHQQQNFVFDYSKHGSDWLSGMCASSNRQSPIDLPLAAASPPSEGDALSYEYLNIAQPVKLENNGHTLVTDLQGYGYGGVTWKNKYYNLVNINFHAPSEHTYGGERYEAEVHLVHKLQGMDDLVIVSVPFAKGAATDGGGSGGSGSGGSGSGGSGSGSGSGSTGSAMLLEKDNSNSLRKRQSVPDVLSRFVEGGFPAVGGSVNITAEKTNPIDINMFLQGGDFYEYEGSLTAPPCSEIATWFVRSVPVETASANLLNENIMSFTNNFGNYRDIKQLGSDRSLTLRTVKRDEPSLDSSAPTISVKMQKDKKAHDAWSVAYSALKEASEMKDYINKVDNAIKQENPDYSGFIPSGAAEAAADASADNQRVQAEVADASVQSDLPVPTGVDSVAAPVA